MDEKVIRNRSWEGLWEVWGGSWEVFGRLLVSGWCLGGSGGVSGSIFGGSWTDLGIKMEWILIRNRRKMIDNSDLNLVLIGDRFSIVF